MVKTALFKRPLAEKIKYDWPYAITYIYLNDPMIMLRQKFGEAWLQKPETPLEVLIEREKRFLGAYYNCDGEPIEVPPEYRQPIPIVFEFPGAERAYHMQKHTIGGGWPTESNMFVDNRTLWMLKAGCCPKQATAAATGTFEVPT